MARNRQIAFLFHEAGDFSEERIDVLPEETRLARLGGPPLRGEARPNILGGKAMSLVTMTQLGMPIPPGFAISTGVCRAYLEHARYPRRLEWQIKRCLVALERQTGKRFGDPSNPLLVSVRSGASVSMPGMMDTILNLGMTEEAIPALGRLGGKRFAVDTYERFRQGFKKVVGSEPTNPWEDLELSFEAICQSWLNDRAIEYRRAHHIPDDLGTAMIVQAMVFGNLDDKSGTGVLFSRNVATGDREPYGEFLPLAQGEDVVGGGITPLPIAYLSESQPRAFRALAEYAEVLEHRENDVVEMEFTVESGKLWILQYRVAKRTPVASARFAVQSVWEKKLSKLEAVSSFGDPEIEKLHRKEFDPRALKTLKTGTVLARGLPASPGAAVGIAVFSSERAQELVGRGTDVILIRPETSPDDFGGMLVASAMVTGAGGITSHAAVVARSLGKPAVVGVGEIARGFRGENYSIRFISADPAIYEGDHLSIDGSLGLVIAGNVPFAYGSHHKEISLFLKWREQLIPRPYGRADFSAVDRKYSANRILNDVYLSDAMALVAIGTELETEAGVLRNRIHREAAEVFACYLIVAVAGELRYGWVENYDPEKIFENKPEGGKWMSQEFEELHEKFGLLPRAIDHSRRFDAQMSVVQKIRDSTRPMQEAFLRLAIPAFNWWRSGTACGGPRWAKIAEAVLGYLSGDIPDKAFVDHVFDLRHNGGRLFDKHPMFGEQTSEARLPLQLDEKKRAQTIDELVVGLVSFLQPDLYPLMSIFPLLGESFSAEVVEVWKKGERKYWGKEV